jgi:hypothetical protein
MPLVLAGATSGQATVQATDAQTVTITLPATSGTLVTTGGAQTIEFADGSASAPSITNSGDTNTGMFFPAADTIAFTEGGVESMRIDSSGNVGIGKTPGTSILDIAGEGQTGSNNMYLTWSTTSSGYAPAYNLRKSNGTKASPTAVVNGDELGVLVFAGYDGSNYQNGAYIQARVDGTPGTNDMPGRIGFFTTPDGSASATERMRITSAGAVCIGRTSQIFGSTGLCVETSSNSVNAVVTASNQSALSAVNTAVNTGTSCSLMSFNVGISGGGSQVGTVTYNGTVVQYNSTSDQRLKKNIVDAGSGLAKLANVKIRAFDWVEHDSHTDFGVVAQELVTVAPEAVSVGDTGETIERIWAVDTSTLVPAMIKAIQEQQAIITDLKARIETLENT